LFDQDSKAIFALAIASLTSLVLANLTSALCSPVAGLNTFPTFFELPVKGFNLLQAFS
jgi:hypothetical protein